MFETGAGGLSMVHFNNWLVILISLKLGDVALGTTWALRGWEPCKQSKHDWQIKLGINNKWVNSKRMTSKSHHYQFIVAFRKAAVCLETSIYRGSMDQMEIEFPSIWWFTIRNPSTTCGMTGGVLGYVWLTGWIKLVLTLNLSRVHALLHKVWQNKGSVTCKN